MTIHITSCSTGKPISYAAVEDIYGNLEYTDAYGNIQVDPGNEDNLIDTLIEVSGAGYETNEFTVTSYGTNSFCLSPAPASTTTTASGGW